MDDTLWLKFTQHLDLQQELLQTGDAELVEVRKPRSFVHRVSVNHTLIMHRIRTKIPSGALGLMDVVATNLERLS